MPSSPTYIFAGGGTGGHLYPGLAVMRELMELEPSARCIFVCSAKPLDAEILRRERVEFVPIPAKAFGVRPLALWRFLKGWGPSVRISRKAVRGAAAVAAMGGYVAAPVVQAARVQRVRVVLVNLDAVPGKANRWIANHASVRLTAAGGRAVPGDWAVVPPIVRRAAFANGTPQVCRARLGLDPNRPTLAITGGSQGAGSLNAFILAFARQCREDLVSGGWQIVHQTGPNEDVAASQAYRELGIPAVATAFCADMAAFWGGADLAVSRCGAGAVGEVWANHVPTLFLPYPYHRDQHQKFNAEPLEEAGGAVIQTDHIDPQTNLVKSGPVLKDLLCDPIGRTAMRAALEALGPADGAVRVARALLNPA